MTRLQHDVVLVSEPVGPLEAASLHGLVGLEVPIAEVLNQLHPVLEALLGRLEPGSLVALLGEQFGEAAGGDAAGLGLDDVCEGAGVEPGVDRYNRLRGV